MSAIVNFVRNRPATAIFVGIFAVAGIALGALTGIGILPLGFGLANLFLKAPLAIQAVNAFISILSVTLAALLPAVITRAVIGNTAAPKAKPDSNLPAYVAKFGKKVLPKQEKSAPKQEKSAPKQEKSAPKQEKSAQEKLAEARAELTEAQTSLRATYKTLNQAVAQNAMFFSRLRKSNPGVKESIEQLIDLLRTIATKSHDANQALVARQQGSTYTTIAEISEAIKTTQALNSYLRTYVEHVNSLRAFADKHLVKKAKQDAAKVIPTYTEVRTTLIAAYVQYVTALDLEISLLGETIRNDSQAATSLEELREERRNTREEADNARRTLFNDPFNKEKQSKRGLNVAIGFINHATAETNARIANLEKVAANAPKAKPADTTKAKPAAAARRKISYLEAGNQRRQAAKQQNKKQSSQSTVNLSSY